MGTVWASGDLLLIMLFLVLWSGMLIPFVDFATDLFNERYHYGSERASRTTSIITVMSILLTTPLYAVRVLLRLRLRLRLRLWLRLLCVVACQLHSHPFCVRRSGLLVDHSMLYGAMLCAGATTALPGFYIMVGAPEMVRRWFPVWWRGVSGLTVASCACALRVQPPEFACVLIGVASAVVSATLWPAVAAFIKRSADGADHETGSVIGVCACVVFVVSRPGGGT